MGDLIFEAEQSAAVGGCGMGGLVQTGRDIAKPFFQARKSAFVETSNGLRLAVAIVKVFDAPGKRVEPFRQAVIDGAVIQRVDLAGNVAEERCQFRLL